MAEEVVTRSYCWTTFSGARFEGAPVAGLAVYTQRRVSAGRGNIEPRGCFRTATYGSVIFTEEVNEKEFELSIFYDPDQGDNDMIARRQFRIVMIGDAEPPYAPDEVYTFWSSALGPEVSMTEEGWANA